MVDGEGGLIINYELLIINYASRARISWRVPKLGIYVE